MTRLVFLGGFLGSGKTTTLLRLATDLVRAGRRVGILTNDQGNELVDTELFRASGLATRDVRGGCFCCRLDDFVEQATALTSATKPDFLFAEPVGSCTDLTATVLRPLKHLHADAFEIGPLTALVDPARARDVLSSTGRASLSDKITYIYKLQQLEADAIAINKIDTLQADERAEVFDLVRSRFPTPRTFCFSARTGEGFDELSEWLRSTPAAAARDSPEIDYDLYAEGEAELAWVDGTFAVRADEPLGLDAASMRLAVLLHERLAMAGRPIAHVKLLLKADDDVSAISIARSNAVPEFSRETGASAASFRVLINARVATAPAQLRTIVEGAVLSWSAALGISVSEESAAAFSPGRPVPTRRIE